MARKIKNIITLDFGSFSTKIIAGSFDGQHITVTKALKVPIPEDCYHDGQIKKPEVLRDILKGTLHDNHISGDACFCTIESSMTIIRDMVLPAAKPKELKDIISYEIQNYLPIELSQYVVQSKILGEVTEEGVKKANVMVAAMPRDIAETHLALLEGIGLKPYSMDIHANSQWKLLGGNRRINKEIIIGDKTVVVIDIGHRQINMNFIEKGQYRFNRLLAMGGHDIDEHIANFYSISMDEARIRKNSIDNINLISEDVSESERLRNLCCGAVETWIDEFERIFKYYTSRSTTNKVDMIMLSGSGAKLNGLDQYIQRTLSIPTVCITELEGIRASSGVGALDIMKFMNALGAMIRQ